MGLVSRSVIDENRQRQSRGQEKKALLKGMVGLAVDVLHVNLLFAEVGIEPLFSGMRMPV
jgi:hypothetical protein